MAKKEKTPEEKAAFALKMKNAKAEKAKLKEQPGAQSQPPAPAPIPAPSADAILNSTPTPPAEPVVEKTPAAAVVAAHTDSSADIKKLLDRMESMELELQQYRQSGSGAPRTAVKKSQLLEQEKTYWINTNNHVMSSYKIDGIEYVSPTMGLDEKQMVYRFGTPIVFKQVNMSLKRAVNNMREDERIYLSSYKTRDQKVVEFIENSPDYKSGRIFQRVADPQNINIYRKRFKEQAQRMIADCSQQDIVFKVLNERDSTGHQLVERSDDYDKMRSQLVDIYAARYEDEDRKALQIRMQQSFATNFTDQEKARFYGLSAIR